MSKQPEALRLADWLERRTNIMLQDRKAAAELRRPHALNVELVESLTRLLSSDKNIAEASDDELIAAANDKDQTAMLREQAAAVLQCREALAKASS